MAFQGSILHVLLMFHVLPVSHVSRVFVAGCPVLETLRNRNIEQPLPRSDTGGAGSHDQDDDDMVQ